MRDVAGKVAFVTGGASGVGLGMATAFSGAGMKVAIADIRRDEVDAAAGQLGGDVHPIRVDVTDRDALAAAADEVEQVFGKVHVVCNNAGINLFNDIGEATYQDWDGVLGVNLQGVINGVVTFVPRIRAHGEGGHLVNTGSMASVHRRAGRRDLHGLEVRGTRSDRGAPLEPAPARDRSVAALPGAREQQHPRERRRSGLPSSRPT